MLRVVCSAGHHDLALLAVIWSICVFSAGWLNLWAGLQTLSVKDMGSRDDVVALWFAGAISYCAPHGVLVALWFAGACLMLSHVSSDYECSVMLHRTTTRWERLLCQALRCRPYVCAGACFEPDVCHVFG